MLRLLAGKRKIYQRSRPLCGNTRAHCLHCTPLVVGIDGGAGVRVWVRPADRAKGLEAPLQYQTPFRASLTAGCRRRLRRRGARLGPTGAPPQCAAAPPPPPHPASLSAPAARPLWARPPPGTCPPARQNFISCSRTCSKPIYWHREHICWSSPLISPEACGKGFMKTAARTKRCSAQSSCSSSRFTGHGGYNRPIPAAAMAQPETLRRRQTVS